MKAPELDTKRLKLRPLGLEHVSYQYVDWMNDSEVIKYLESGGDYNITKLKDYISGLIEKDILCWAIHTRESNTHIGNIKIDPINFTHMYAEYGAMIGAKEHWGMGYAREASQATIQYCFHTLHLRKICLGVICENTSAIRLYKKLGFRVEGVYKKHVYYDGKFIDIIRMAIFKDHFDALFIKQDD